MLSLPPFLPRGAGMPQVTKPHSLSVSSWLVSAHLSRGAEEGKGFFRSSTQLLFSLLGACDEQIPEPGRDRQGRAGNPTEMSLSCDESSPWGN